MEDRVKVSIIIGCYNVSEWLREKRLSCILNQTYKNLEILLINDGSTDDTLSICEEMAKLDSRIRIISKENGGLGSARNTGLDNATGDFVWFYDVDDEAELILVEKNVSWMINNHSDLNIFSYWCITPSLKSNQEIRFKNYLVTSNEQLKSIFLDDLMFVPNGNGFAWNKFYRREFLEEHQIRFGNQRIQQDELFNIQIYPYLNRAYVSSDLLYHYFIYTSGNTRSKFIPKRYDIYLSINRGLREFFEKWDLKDHRLETYTNDRLYSGMNSSILFNTFHKDAPYSISEKKSIVKGILNNPESRKCLNKVDTSRFSIDQRLYYFAYKKESFLLICGFRFLFQFLREVKHFVSF